MAELPQAHLKGLRVAVTGASGNVGTALLRRLTAPGSGVAEVRGLARRQPPDTEPYSSVTWYRADLGETSSEQALTNLMENVDAVVHLAWVLQPGRKTDELHKANVDGTRRVMRAAVAAGVAHVVHMSSLGAYAAGGGARPVTEDWPVTGIPSSQYSRQKSEAERVVREVVGRRKDVTLTVVRPTLVLQPEAASEIGRYFLGPLLFGAARLVPTQVASVLPLPLPSLRVGLVHADDVADAITRMLDRRAPGPFNLSAEPALDADGLARALGTTRIPVPAAVLRAGLAVAYRAHLTPTEPGWLDLGLQSPVLETARARTQLGWQPAHRGDDVLRQFVAALGRGDGGPGPLLSPAGGREHDPAGDPANVPNQRPD